MFSWTKKNDPLSLSLSLPGPCVQDRTLFYNTDGELKKAPPFGTFGQVLRACVRVDEGFSRRAKT